MKTPRAVGRVVLGVKSTINPYPYIAARLDPDDNKKKLLLTTTRDAQVNSICFLEPNAALATCNLEGVVAVWRMGPDPAPNPAAPPRKDDNAEREEEDEEDESTREDGEGVGVDKKTNFSGASTPRRSSVSGGESLARYVRGRNLRSDGSRILRRGEFYVVST